MEKHGYVYDFSVDYDAIAVADMKKTLDMFMILALIMMLLLLLIYEAFTSI